MVVHQTNMYVKGSDVRTLCSSSLSTSHCSTFSGFTASFTIHKSFPRTHRTRQNCCCVQYGHEHHNFFTVGQRSLNNGPLYFVPSSDSCSQIVGRECNSAADPEAMNECTLPQATAEMRAQNQHFTVHHIHWTHDIRDGNT
jgi:hypothetical protein